MLRFLVLIAILACNSSHASAEQWTMFTKIAEKSAVICGWGGTTTHFKWTLTLTDDRLFVKSGTHVDFVAKVAADGSVSEQFKWGRVPSRFDGNVKTRKFTASNWQYGCYFDLVE